ncbi:hypothetical protein [Halorarum halobium]|uniref:DUF5789 family protein n=1 Tax=Halorarum halobium TaxID=3075121 RepID=UPI0028AE6C7C|nr:hypothetical protein [Halobaculum sp. XH14]
MADDDTEREGGVDFSAINPLLAELSYPVTAEELVERHGDRELKPTNAEPISIAELFEPMGDATFESAEEVRRMALGQMPSESVGREGYSDRGTDVDTGDEDEAAGDESF